MPSPFPGMDPYLEHPALWPGVHQGLITYMQAALNTLLPPRYVADIGERLYVVQPERSIYPDSPSNKTAGTPGRDLYLTQQRELLGSQTHLIELDFLHYGEHTIVPPRPRLLEQGMWDYLVSLHRGNQGHRYEVWAVTLRQRLPRIRVPLTDEAPDVVLDLQTIFDRCYDAAAYARRLDYHSDPPLSLSQDNAAWVTALLRERGLRA